MAAVTPDLLITVSPYDTTGTPEPPGWLFSLMPPFSAIFFFFLNQEYIFIVANVLSLDFLQFCLFSVARVLHHQIPGTITVPV